MENIQYLPFSRPYLGAVARDSDEEDSDGDFDPEDPTVTGEDFVDRESEVGPKRKKKKKRGTLWRTLCTCFLLYFTDLLNLFGEVYAQHCTQFRSR